MQNALMRWVFTLGFVVCATAWAATSYRVNTGDTTQVDEHGTCQNVINGSVFDVLVPTNTSTEWSMFRTNPPPSITFSSCSGCTSGTSTYTTEGAGTFTMPASCNYASVKAWGAGGGGGNNNAASGAGGGGGYATRDVSVASGGTITFTIATGGAAGACATTVTGGPGGYAGGNGGVGAVAGYAGSGVITGGSGGTGTQAGGQGYYGGGGGGGKAAARKGGGGGGATTAVDTRNAITFLVAGGGGGGGGASGATGGAGGAGCGLAGGNGGTMGGGGGGGACYATSSTAGSTTLVGNSAGAAAGVGLGGVKNGTCAGTGDGTDGEISIDYSYVAPALSVNDVITTEGYSLIFLVSLSTYAVTSNVTFDFATVDGTATAGTDFTGNSGTRTITTGNRSLNITIVSQVRGGDNGTRAMSITFTNLSGASASDMSGAGTIYDNTTCTNGALTLSANGTFTLPTGCTSLTVEAWGAGGASAIDSGGTSKTGGSGGYAKKTYTGATPGTVYTGTIGVGGLCTRNGGSGAFAGGQGGGANSCTVGSPGAGGGTGGAGGTSARCTGGAGRYGGGGGAGGEAGSTFGGGGGGASGVSVSGTYILIAGGGGGSGPGDQGVAGAGGPGCSVAGGTGTVDSGGGGGGGACYCEGTGCTQTANGTLAASPADPGVAAPTSGKARGGPAPAAGCSGTTNDGTDGMIRFTYGP